MNMESILDHNYGQKLLELLCTRNNNKYLGKLVLVKIMHVQNHVFTMQIRYI